MRDIEKALDQISEIHRHLSRTEVYRGYRSIPVALAGLTGIIGAGLQTWVVQAGAPDWYESYVYYWIEIGAFAFLVAISGVILYWINNPDPHLRRHTLHVVGQFAPCLLAGLFITLMVLPQGEAAIRLLPGLWTICYSLGVFASRPYLPRFIGWVAAFYLLAGVILLGLAQSEHSLSPWGMGITFGGGHLTSATILYWSLERNAVHVET
jgi:hypothetical protein